MKNEIMEERIINALQKQEALPPVRHELGGGFYYKCHWLACDRDINTSMDYCPGCGQKIQWGEENETINYYSILQCKRIHG